MGLRGTARQWSLAVWSIVRSPGDVRYLPVWLRSLRVPRSSGPLMEQVPYMPFSLRQTLDAALVPSARAFEYGSGGSTMWLAKRVGQLTSIEHHPQWHERVEADLQRAGVTNCRLRLVEPSSGTRSAAGGYRSPLAEGDFEGYVKAISECGDDSLDLVLVDGRCRAACVLEAAAKVRPGGLLVLDDSDRDRYAPAHEGLRAWPRRDFWGIKPFTVPPARTTVWIKPQAIASQDESRRAIAV